MVETVHAQWKIAKIYCLKNRTRETFYYKFAKIDLVSIKIGIHTTCIMM